MPPLVVRGVLAPGREQQMIAFAEKMVPVAANLGWPADAAMPKLQQVHHYWLPGAGT
ncbi:hypothetical protein ABZ128_05070 [Streptomyces sp. NPDC006326]|uniref:hypothetical protein n=1 Tax=Streptomyces sp. NPDC006326 TaxID=3156752 RepID=UPI0033A2B1C9